MATLCQVKQARRSMRGVSKRGADRGEAARSRPGPGRGEWSSGSSPVGPRAWLRRAWQVSTGVAKHLTLSLLCALLLAPHGAARAQPADTDALLAALNAFRSTPQRCGDTRLPAAAPLRHAPVLSAEAPRVAAQGRGALQRAGYLPARVELLQVRGIRSADALAAIVQQRHCATLMNAALRDLGVARDGAQWTLVFAQPALDPALGDWRAAGQRVLALVNEARRTPRRCGSDAMPPAPPLTWNDALAAAALAHSRDMARSQRFDHRGSDDSEVGARATRQGYAWQAVGENIAAGPGSARQVVEGWIGSPGHCANLMSAEFTQMGAAFVIAPEAPLAIYWTQVFGTPRR